MTYRRRKSLARDFDRRARHSNVESGRYGEFISVHSYGQHRCDAYWQYQHEVVMLEVAAATHAAGRHPGLYARWNERSPTMLNLVAILESSDVSASAFTHAMEAFVRAGVFGRRRPAQRVKRLCKIDTVSVQQAPSG